MSFRYRLPSASRWPATSIRTMRRAMLTLRVVRRPKAAVIAKQPATNDTRQPIMTYVDAACAPLRKTGQIKIHGPAAFAGMRKAGQLAAECLDMLVGAIKPGVTTEHIDRLV